MKQGLLPLDPTDATAVEHMARLHAELLPGSPIARLGRRFMTRFYYRSLVAEGLLGCYLDYVDGQPAGFIACTAQPTRFMIEGLRRHWLYLPAVLLLEIVTDPRRLRVILWTLQYMRRGAGTPAEPGEGEILSFGVVSEFRTPRFVRRSGRRVSWELFMRARDYYRVAGVERYRAVVQSDNREALMFYHAQGCRVNQGVTGGPRTLVIACQESCDAGEDRIVGNQ